MSINIRLLFSIAFGFLLSNTHTAQAVEPTIINHNSGVQWSSPIKDDFDGLIVHDKHSFDDNIIVSSWSKQAIRLTFSKEFSERTGSHQVRSCKKNKDKQDCTWKEEPTYSKYTKNYKVSSFIVSVNNRLHKYEQGEVSPQLAQTLATAPIDKNVRIRIVTTDGFTVDSEIGTGTVKAWQQIFR
jgi:hypothetical protein